MTAQAKGRGTETCRGCARDGLVSVLDLGSQPLANRLLATPHDPDPVWPLHLKTCPTCGLGQVGEFVAPSDIFDDYPYLSSMSSYWLEHVGSYSRQLVKELGLGPGDLVVEIASNDGALLKAFQSKGVSVLGVEPAANVVELARSQGVPTDNSFFGVDTARRLVESHGHPRLVAANNVLAHVPDLDDFVAGFATICGPDTVITVENPTFTNLLLHRQFDTIYHEHFSYLSAHAVRILAEKHGLVLFRVEQLPTHGGSNRYWLAAAGARIVEDSVERAVRAELDQGLLSPALWREFAAASWDALDSLRAWFDERRTSGARVVGYGAAAKGNTLLNAAGITAENLVAVTDRSVEKQHRFLPGSHAPVVPPDWLPELHPTDVLVLPWNIAPELVLEIRSLMPGARTWVAVPSMQELTA